MSIIVHVLISVVFYFVLMLLSINLIGFLVRGFFTDPELAKLKTSGSEFVKQEIEKSQCVDKRINIVALLLIIGYLYLVFHFWNIGVVIIAVVLMTGRLPDLLWEIKSGKKTTTSAMPKNALYFIATFLNWACFPALYYFLYHF